VAFILLLAKLLLKEYNEDMNKRIIIPILFIIAVLIGIIIYVQSSKSPNNGGIPTPTLPVSQPNTTTPEFHSTTAPSISEKGVPSVTSPKPNTKVTSPFSVTGTVPPGWMFEGVFPVKLLDAKKKVIAQTQGKEVTPGSWSSGSDVAFRASVEFTTAEKSGFLVLEKDNPSGLPENADSFEIPVTF
jgi:hypothetical protein